MGPIRRVQRDGHKMLLRHSLCGHKGPVSCCFVRRCFVRDILARYGQAQHWLGVGLHANCFQTKFVIHRTIVQFFFVVITNKVLKNFMTLDNPKKEMVQCTFNGPLLKKFWGTHLKDV